MSWDHTRCDPCHGSGLMRIISWARRRSSVWNTSRKVKQCTIMKCTLCGGTGYVEDDGFDDEDRETA